MAVIVTLDRKAENEAFFVMVVQATAPSGAVLPEKRVSISKSGIADGVVTLPGERDRVTADAEQRIRNYEAAEKALAEFEL